MTESDYLLSLKRLCDVAIEQFNLYQLGLSSDLMQPGSPAERDSTWTSQQAGPDGTWSSSFIADLTRRSLVYLSIAPQHLSALRTLLGNPPFGLPIGSPIRSVVECSSRSVWLVSAELAIGENARQRVARLFLDIDDDLTRMSDLARALGHPEKAVIKKQAKDAHRRIAKPGVFRDDEIKKVEETRFLAGEEMPGPVALVKLAERAIHANRRVAASSYDYLSAMSHPSAFAFIESMATPTSGPSGSLLTIREDLNFTGRLIIHGVQAFCDAWRNFSSWTGTSMQQVEVVISEVNEVYAETYPEEGSGSTPS